jgi:hypothetical protein
MNTFLLVWALPFQRIAQLNHLTISRNYIIISIVELHNIKIYYIRYARSTSFLWAKVLEPLTERVIIIADCILRCQTCNLWLLDCGDAYLLGTLKLPDECLHTYTHYKYSLTFDT